MTLDPIQRQVRRAFLAWPDRQYLTAELIEWPYPRLTGKFERKQRVAVIRAATKVALRVRRAEMWQKSKQWLEEPAGVNMPDSDSLQTDACGPGYKYDSNTRLMLEKKEDMRRRGVPSPDEWDAVALTFAEPVNDTPKLRTLNRRPLGANAWMSG